MQVDGLCAMMGGADELLGKAEHLCKVMQVIACLMPLLTNPSPGCWPHVPTLKS